MARLITFLLTLGLSATGWAQAVAPEGRPSESSPSVNITEAPRGGTLLDLNLEQLMNLELIQTTVPGAHWHWQDDWMVGYQYMHMQNQGYKQGPTSVSNEQVLKQFPTIHTSMTMDMHMLMLMYGPNNDVTLMVTLPYLDMSMDHLTSAGKTYRTFSSGFGDLRISPIISVYDEYPHRIQVEAGVSFPTGSITQQDQTPTGLQQLEYKMQTGSGTIDLQPALTYLGQNDDMSWGAQLRGTVRTGRNSRGYRQGDMIEFTTWWSPTVAENFSPAIRIDAMSWGNVRGQDPQLNPSGNPESAPYLQGGSQINLLFGVNFSTDLDDQGRGHRFSIEGGFPIYQNLNGPQLRESWRLGGAWNWTF